MNGCQFQRLLLRVPALDRWNQYGQGQVEALIKFLEREIARVEIKESSDSTRLGTLVSLLEVFQTEKPRKQSREQKRLPLRPCGK